MHKRRVVIPLAISACLLFILSGCVTIIESPPEATSSPETVAPVLPNEVMIPDEVPQPVLIQEYLSGISYVVEQEDIIYREWVRCVGDDKLFSAGGCWQSQSYYEDLLRLQEMWEAGMRRPPTDCAMCEEHHNCFRKVLQYAINIYSTDMRSITMENSWEHTDVLEALWDEIRSYKSNRNIYKDESDDMLAELKQLSGEH
jgi:hypothetical protein